MYRSYNYHSSSSSYYSASDEDLERLDRLQRMPSMIADTPYFPNVHEVLNNHPVHVEENYNHHKKKKSDKNNKSDKINRQSPGHKKVHFAENEKTDVSRDGKRDAHEGKSIDAEADGFIQQKHRGFELCKWDTFRVY
ncbi:hypothetical protein ACS0TY_007145 [Phlomoides rotata]